MSALRGHQTWHRWRVLLSETGGWVAIPPDVEWFGYHTPTLAEAMDVAYFDANSGGGES